jgi:Tfp pilus assembly protein PilX
LLITLIVLVAMTLAAISLMRSVDTTNVIAGNLAFRQGATLAGDTGIQRAIQWLEQNSGATLNSQQNAAGYSPVHQEPGPGQSWDLWWNQVVAPNRAFTMAVDAAGNTVSYTIDRMCAQPWDPLTPGANCSQTTVTTSTGTGSSQSAGTQSLQTSTQIYYRITSRTVGPRNSVSYVQAIVAL